MYKDYLNILSKCPLFKGIGKNDMPTLLSCLTPNIKKYQKGDYIVTSNQELNHICVVLSGSVSLYKESPTGDSTLVTTLMPSELFGEALVFSSNNRLPVSAFVTEPSEILFVSSDKIITPCNKICNIHNVLSRNLLNILSQKLFMLNKRIEYLTIKSMRQKLVTFLLDEANKHKSNSFKLAMNRNDLADFLNVSRPSMSRELGRMKNEGLIDFSGDKFTVLNIK